ncbi:unnamed protein product [Symbiodinium natans]|uniref:Uncharacterized protein n=1 Tax=Symbiodinium natans TaxID=878477 RepID=A0A812G8C9_9DINO|nr:unnamed protein product [Symbiodinium natans]
MAGGVTTALDFVTLCALVTMRSYIAQCRRARSVCDATPEVQALFHWGELFMLALIASRMYALYFVDAWSAACSPSVLLLKGILAAASVGLCTDLRAFVLSSPAGPVNSEKLLTECSPEGTSPETAELDVCCESGKDVDSSSDETSSTDSGDDDGEFSDDSLDEQDLSNEEQGEPADDTNARPEMPNVKEMPPPRPIQLINSDIHLRMLRSGMKMRRLACINEEVCTDKPKWLAYLGRLVAHELLPRVPLGAKNHTWDNAFEALTQLHEWLQSDDAEPIRQAYKPCLGFRCECCGSAVKPEEQACGICSAPA